MTGYIIQPSRPRATILILVGRGNDGKTKLVQTIGRLLGSNAVYSHDVASLQSSPFGIGNLVGKLLFLDDDVKAGARLPDGVLKKISEGKELTGERKHKDAFNFINRALPVLLFNNVPSIADLSEGLRRRLMVFACDRSFTPEEEDITLFDRIWASELPGILNRALNGWREFVANGKKFQPSTDLNTGKRVLLVKANPLAAFIEERCEFKPDASICIDDLFTAYKDWSSASGYNFAVVRNTLKEQCRQLGYGFKTVNGYPWVVGLSVRKPGKRGD